MNLLPKKFIVGNADIDGNSVKNVFIKKIDLKVKA